MTNKNLHVFCWLYQDFYETTETARNDQLVWCIARRASLSLRVHSTPGVQRQDTRLVSMITHFTCVYTQLSAQRLGRIIYRVWV